MNRLGVENRAAIFRALVEGNSIRATARLTGTAKATVLKLLVELGEFCSIYQDQALRNLNCQQVDTDVIWSFVDAKERKATKPGLRDLWTYTGICTDSKLVVSWLVAARNHENTFAFMEDIAFRLASRVQLTPDDLSWHVGAVEEAFGWGRVDCPQLIKAHGIPLDETERQRRCSPAVRTDAIKTRIMGKPHMQKVSTSYVARRNLQTRMEMCRFTGLTTGFSKKAENHARAVSLYFMFHNYCNPHQTLTKAANGIKTTPAMAAGIADHVWTVEEIVEKVQPAYPLE